MSHELLKLPTTVDFLSQLQAKAPKDVMRINGSMFYGDETKYVSVSFDPKKYKTLELLMITDTQFGHLMCQEDRIVEYRDWILSEPNRFVLFGGDMVDAATVLSIASPYENKFEPATQVRRFVEMMLPMRHRIIGYVGGNHERRSVRAYGSLGREIATYLQIPYSEGKQFIDIHYGKHVPFKVSLWHGKGAAQTKGSKAQMLHQFMREADSDLYLCGHLHDVVLLFDWRQYRANNHIKLRKIAGVMSSSFLEYFATYAEVAGLSPSETMMARCILEPDGGWEITLR